MGFLTDFTNRIRQTGIPLSLIIYCIVGYAFIWFSHPENGILFNILIRLGANAGMAQMLKDSSKIFGQTFIISGVATSILRTNFFTNILQQQLFKVVYSEELLKN